MALLVSGRRAAAGGTGGSRRRARHCASERGCSWWPHLGRACRRRSRPAGDIARRHARLRSSLEGTNAHLRPTIPPLRPGDGASASQSPRIPLSMRAMSPQMRHSTATRRPNLAPRRARTWLAHLTHRGSHGSATEHAHCGTWETIDHELDVIAFASSRRSLIFVRSEESCVRAGAAQLELSRVPAWESHFVPCAHNLLFERFSQDALDRARRLTSISGVSTGAIIQACLRHLTNCAAQVANVILVPRSACIARALGCTPPGCARRGRERTGPNPHAGGGRCAGRHMGIHSGGMNCSEISRSLRYAR